jgi:hypothetical protein
MSTQEQEQQKQFAIMYREMSKMTQCDICKETVPKSTCIALCNHEPILEYKIGQQLYYTICTCCNETRTESLDRLKTANNLSSATTNIHDRIPSVLSFIICFQNGLCDQAKDTTMLRSLVKTLVEHGDTTIINAMLDVELIQSST